MGEIEVLAQEAGFSEANFWGNLSTFRSARSAPQRSPIQEPNENHFITALNLQDHLRRGCAQVKAPHADWPDPTRPHSTNTTKWTDRIVRRFDRVGSTRGEVGWEWQWLFSSALSCQWKPSHHLWLNSEPRLYFSCKRWVESKLLEPRQKNYIETRENKFSTSNPHRSRAVNSEINDSEVLF